MKISLKRSQWKKPAFCLRCLNPSGFTMIELMLSMVVLGVMAATIAPAVNGYFTRHSLQYATDELYGDIQLARMRAANNNRRCRIRFGMPGPDQYSIWDVDNNGIVSATPFKIGDLTRFRNNIAFTNSPNPADPDPYMEIEFLSTGVVAWTLPAVSDSVYLTNQANDVFYRVLVSAAGGTDVDRWEPIATQWR